MCSAALTRDCMSTSMLVVANLNRLSSELLVRQRRCVFFINFNVENRLSHMYVLPNIDATCSPKFRRFGNRSSKSNLKNSKPLSVLPRKERLA